MNIERQKKKFTPITITLETREEVFAMFDLVRFDSSREESVRELALKISEWLSIEENL